MGYGFYTVRWGAEERPAGYMVIAECDRRGCHVQIDRGLGYLCGGDQGAGPHDMFSDESGCGRYYCGQHSGWVGPRGGCSHGRRGKAWGRTLSDMVPNADGTIVCLDLTGHSGPHAWAAPEPDA